MAAELPDAIARYFAADAGTDADTIAQCFADSAIVTDEGHTHVGRDAIRRWKTEAASRYCYTAQPVAVAAQGDRTVVTSHLVGDFPGSPVDLRYIFLLEGPQIAALEIVP